MAEPFVDRLTQMMQRIGEDVLPDPVRYADLTPEMVRDAFIQRWNELRAEVERLKAEYAAAVEVPTILCRLNWHSWGVVVGDARRCRRCGHVQVRCWTRRGRQWTKGEKVDATLRVLQFTEATTLGPRLQTAGHPAESRVDCLQALSTAHRQWTTSVAGRADRARGGGGVSDVEQYTVAELFCGCGGLSHGFTKSGHFRVVLGNDIKKAALRTFVHNHSRKQAPPEVLEGDIRAISIHQIEEALQRQGVAPGELDCLIGGPPCQGFSQMRRGEERLVDGLVRFKGYNKLDDDPRNDLVLRFLEIVNALRPKIVLIENVPQMLRHGHNGVLGGLAASVQSRLQEMGYTVVVGVINSADYGVPQLRERSLFLASRIGRIDFPEATHADPEATELISRGLLPWNTVRDALRDLPAAAPAKETLGGGPLGRANLSDYARLMRSDRQFPFNHLTRSYSQRIIDIVQDMKPGETWDSASERMQCRYEKLIAKRVKEGSTKNKAMNRRTAKAQLVKEGIVNPVFYRRYYWSAYTRLAWDRPALTITANCNFLGSGRFTHPEEDRGITMREAARLQSFEDDFCFITAATRDDTATIGVGMDMIGEAVPPLLGEAFGRRTAAALRSWSPFSKECES